jgi:hypothetical protein
MPDLYDELKALIRSLNENRVPYALCGGLALAVHGLTRATVDIDLLVPKESLAAARSVARELGYTIDAAPMSFAGGAVEIRRVSKVDSDSGEILMLDFLLVTEALAKVWETHEKVEWEQGSLWVVSRSGLVALKNLRRSGQDLDDIERLTEGPDEA